MNGVGGTSAFRPNQQARFFISNADDWHKAAYYDPLAEVYYDYATGSNETPTPIVSGTEAGTAVVRPTSTIAPAELAGGRADWKWSLWQYRCNMGTRRFRRRHGCRILRLPSNVQELRSHLAVAGEHLNRVVGASAQTNARGACR